MFYCCLHDFWKKIIGETAESQENNSAINAKPLGVLDAETIKVVYECLNGKDRSCISGRGIPGHKIKCALEKAFGRTGRSNIEYKFAEIEMVASRLSSDKEEEAFRLSFVDGIIEHLSGKDGIRAGSKVRIRRSSGYAHQNNGIGVLQFDYDDDDEEEYNRVVFENGYSNNYRKKDLTSVGFPVNSKNFTVTKNVVGEDRTVFLNRIKRECFEGLKLASKKGKSGKDVVTDEELHDLLDNAIKNVLFDLFPPTSGWQLEEKFVSAGKEELMGDRMFVPIEGGNYALNFSDISKFVAPHLNKLYSDSSLYSPSILKGPPAERLPNVLQLELTTGCNYNKCTYCELYNGAKHNQKTAEEFIQYTDKVLSLLGGHREEISRVFLGSGNGLDVDQDTLKKCLSYLESKLDLNRIAIYANTQSMLKKDVKSLQELRKAGLSCIYWGAESGSDEVLTYVRKGNTFDEMLLAGKKINEAGIDLSVMIMPGLGGSRYAKEHVEGTVNLLNTIGAKYITLMAINPGEKSPYKRKMDKEQLAGENKPLSDLEVVKQIKEILHGIVPKGQKIGIFGDEIDIVGANPVNFKVVFNRSGKEEAIGICDAYIRKHK